MPKYHKGYKGLIDVIKFNIGYIRNDKGLIEVRLTINGAHKPPTKYEMKNSVSKSRNSTIACMFVLGVYKTQFGMLMVYLENSYTQGDDKYSVDLTE